jgi:hypothetical protein
MSKGWHVGLSLIMVMIISGAVIAQEPEPSQPRLLLMSAVRDEQFIIGHDLYRLAGDTWEAVTTDGYKGGFSLSPSGFIMAYQAVPDAVRPVIDGGAGWLASAVWDLRLLDLTTGESRLIAGQPSTLDVSADGQIRNGITRSTPVWSPEATALAWTEQDYPATGTARLLTYNLISGETRVLDESLPQVTMSADGLPRDVSWGESGLVVFANDPETGAETLRFYDPAAGLTQGVTVADGFGEHWLPLTGPLWVTMEGSAEQVVIQAGSWRWWRVDPETAEVTQFCGPLEWVSAAAPDQSLRLIRDTPLTQTDGEWRLVSPDGAEVIDFAASRSQSYATPALWVVLSPQGERAAYPDAGRITIYDMGKLTTLDIPAGLSNPTLYWGWAEWRSAAPVTQSCAVG